MTQHDDVAHIGNFPDFPVILAPLFPADMFRLAFATQGGLKFHSGVDWRRFEISAVTAPPSPVSKLRHKCDGNARRVRAILVCVTPKAHHQSGAAAKSHGMWVPVADLTVARQEALPSPSNSTSCCVRAFPLG